VPGVVVHSGHLFDHVRDAREGPQVGIEPMSPSAPTKCPFDLLESLPIQSRKPARPTRASQRLRASAFPLMIPAAHALSAHLEGASHFRRDRTAGEQPRGLPPPQFQCLEISPWTKCGLHTPIMTHFAGFVTLLCETQ